MNIILRAVWAVTITIVLYPADNLRAEGREEKTKNFLWKVAGKASPVYLYGSIHLAKAEIYPLPRAVEESFEKSGALALEANPDRLKEDGLQMQMLTGALYPGSETLRQHLSTAAYDLAARKMKQAGVSIELVEKTRPWFIAMTLELMALEQQGYRAEYGLDVHFANKAGEKKVIELESFDFQINLLNSFNEREQELFLLYTIKETEAAKTGISEMMTAWRTGNGTVMENVLLRNINEFPEGRPIYEKLIFERNRTMAARIEELLKSGQGCFVVVGAAHLVGDEGIVAILKRKGYRVEQM